ncbi:hypothetical protein ElyMa_005851100 [Elysia marginata]|uniref:Uncharacterized protein n=1 Tax=Elysia marginata TaxID=1093978 RepID=A0AAV4FYV1_9GAST|nr:hypothetical protein ElyMa_005851100 [Elysia marginata]
MINMHGCVCGCAHEKSTPEPSSLYLQSTQDKTLKSDNPRKNPGSPVNALAVSFVRRLLSLIPQLTLIVSPWHSSADRTSELFFGSPQVIPRDVF